MEQNKSIFSLFLNFTKQQKIGILVLISIIVFVQMFLFFFPFEKNKSKINPQWIAIQTTIDSLKNEKPKQNNQYYPFNPNFITEYKGYKLGMSSAEITKLLKYRKTGKYVNSASEFQSITGVSDSLLAVMAPFFKFPEWVNNPNSNFKSNNWKKFPEKAPIKIKDLNEATKEDFMAVYGVGDAISDRILNYKMQFGSFVSMDQLQEVWGLSPEVIKELNTHFELNSTPKVNKININTATIKQLGSFPYFKYPISKNIVSYRSMNGDIKNEDLTKIKGFPVDKLKIIVLYLDY